jgi:nascent polypeptide-associated complex subunit alpha
MFPGMNGIDPRMMKQAMKRMGIKQDELEATQVIIKLKDKMLVFDSPEITKIDMSGNVSFQLAGEYEEKSLDNKVEINDDDIKTVMDQTGSDYDEAKEAIEETNGDLAEAILKLSEK